MAAVVRSVKRVHLVLFLRSQLRIVSGSFFHSGTQLCGVKPLEIKMPALSPTMMEGTIVKWHKKEGEPVIAGDALCDIQTDKAIMTFETEEPGTLAKIMMSESSKNVKIGTLIALMVEEGQDWKDVELPLVTSADKGTNLPKTKPKSSIATNVSSHAGTPGKHLIHGPAVRTLLLLYDLDATKIPASGQHGNLLKSDVMQYVTANKLLPVIQKSETPKMASVPTPQPTISPSVAAPKSSTGQVFTDLENTSMRQTIAKRLKESKASIPHAYAVVNCNVDELVKLRKLFKADGSKASMNDLLIKAVATAIQRVPVVNAQWNSDGVKQQATIDISVAVATDKGLITPIIKDVSSLGLGEISARMKDLAQRAREGKLQLHEFQGGSFTISNLGMYGITEFSAIINPPQSSILAIGSSRLVLKDSDRPTSQMTLTLSYDRRVIDENEAAQFLDELRNIIEHPEVVLVGISNMKRTSI